jgi:4-amino-4-deoxy-L-arabinose transferase-like glycosyltransferase
LALLAYAAIPTAMGGRRLAWAAGLGVAAGLALLSKYAAVYLLVGIALHLALSPTARRAWTPGAVVLALAGALAMLGPNLAWNAAHGFATFHHTAADADWDRGELINPAGLGRFALEQALIFGLIPAGALALAAVRAARRRRFEGADLMLACFAASPLVIVAVQAFISRANANWAAAAYLPGAVLAGALLTRWRAHRWLSAALAIQGAGAAAFVLLVVSPRAAAFAHVDNSFKRVRGWRETTALVLDRAQVEQAAGGLSVVAVDNRFLFHELAYYGRDWFADPRNPPLRAWLAEARPQNQAELAAPLTPASGARVLVASYEGWRAADVAADFGRTSAMQTLAVPLDAKRRRHVVMFVGEALAPKPRPLNGRATPP